MQHFTIIFISKDIALIEGHDEKKILQSFGHKNVNIVLINL